MNRRGRATSPRAPQDEVSEPLVSGALRRSRPTSGSRSLFSVLLALWFFLPNLHAQNVPRIGYVYPAGGQQGTTFTAAVGGQFLDGATNVCVSGDGFQARVIEHIKPLTQNQANTLREQLKELQDRKAAATRTARRAASKDSLSSTNVAWTANDDKNLAEIRGKLATFQRRTPNPAIAETVRIEVTLAADAELGDRELRLRAAQGLSNPLRFCVGQLPEFREKEETVGADRPAVNRPLAARGTPPRAPEAPLPITLPAVVNGQILAGDADRFQFPARQHQELVVAVAAQELIPYLPDAVPGWFQATVALYNGKGEELAFADDYRFRPDPVLHHPIPEDGTYAIEIRDAIYRGREDFVYRITLGELPFVTGVFPLGGPAGTKTAVRIDGWNLPTNTLTIDPSEPGIHTASVRQEGMRSKRVPFAADTLPECLEAEPNNEVGGAQPIAPGIVVNGRIDPPGDVDVFRFTGRAGSSIVAEVLARRLESPLDSLLELTDATGRRLALNDDHEDKGAGRSTHHADSRLSVALPGDGTYYLHLRDTQRQGGSEFAYRLRVSPPRPDFELRIVPASLTFRAGSTVLLTAYALRKDGFTGEIALAVKEPPGTFLLSGARVPSGQDQVRFTLTLTRTPPPDPFPIVVEGRAVIEGREIRRPGVPAEDQMQAFAYRHLVPAQELLALSARAAARAPARASAPTLVKIPAGGTTNAQVAFPAGRMADRFQFELNEAPEGITLESATASPRGVELVLRCDAAKARAGTRGNLIVNAFTGPAPTSSTPARPQAPRRRAAAGLLPAIPFEIVAQP